MQAKNVVALSHPLVLGVFSHANRSVEVTISTFVMGVVWALVFLRTHSRRWRVFSHFLVDMLALSVATFLNVCSCRRGRDLGSSEFLGVPRRVGETEPTPRNSEGL